MRHYHLIYNNYTEHCSVGPTKLIETTIASTTTTARMKISDDEDFRFRFQNLDF